MLKFAKLFKRQKKSEITFRISDVKAGKGTRTPDLGITNASLYQLSHSGERGKTICFPPISRRLFDYID